MDKKRKATIYDYHKFCYHFKNSKCKGCPLQETDCLCFAHDYNDKETLDKINDTVIDFLDKKDSEENE